MGENRYLHAGAQGSFVSRDVLFDKVILGTQLDIDRGVIIGQPGDGFEGDSQQRTADLLSGRLYYDSKFWLGFSAFHLLSPEISYLEADGNQLPIKYSAHGGIKFDLSRGVINDFFNNTNQERSISIAINYKSQGSYSQLDLGTEFILSL